MNRVLDAAVRLFRERGYNGTSVADLRAMTGLTAGSLYKAFQDKRGLFVAALDHYVARREATLAKRLGEAHRGRGKILATLYSYADVSHGPEGRIGCMVLAGLTEADTFDAALADRFRQAISSLERRFRNFIEQGIEDASLPDHLDVSTTAQYLVCVAEGLRALGKRGAKRSEAHAIVEQAMRALR